MHIEIMNEADCLAFIRGERTGRLACSSNNRPYVVPVHYVCSGSSIISFSMPGQKLEFMRVNPNVCLEVDSVNSARSWKCVVVQGVFVELTTTEDKQDAWEVLQKYNDWWEVGSQHVRPEQQDGTREPIFFSISIDLITGRRSRSAEA